MLLSRCLKGSAVRRVPSFHRPSFDASHSLSTSSSGNQHLISHDHGEVFSRISPSSSYYLQTRSYRRNRRCPRQIPTRRAPPPFRGRCYWPSCCRESLPSQPLTSMRQSSPSCSFSGRIPHRNRPSWILLSVRSAVWARRSRQEGQCASRNFVFPGSDSLCLCLGCNQWDEKTLISIMAGLEAALPPRKVPSQLV